MHIPALQLHPLDPPGRSNLQAKNHASGFRALVLIGVAASFYAAFTPHITKPCVASRLAEAEHPVTCPPQWLLSLLATASTVDAALLNANARSVFNEAGSGHMIISPISSNPSAVSPQWLPILLATGYPSPSPPSPSPPPMLPPSPPPPSPSPPSPSPPPECAKVTLETKGWQMLSFNCIGNMSDTFNVLEAVTWGVDDKIMTRDPFLKFATFNGDKFVGGLVDYDQLSMSLGYKIFYSGAEGAVSAQAGAPQLPVEDVVLSTGWNWIGHAPLTSYGINTGITAVGSETFTTDDQIKTRTGSVVSFTTYDGSTFQGGLLELEPGVGYEVKVAQAVTFRYTTPQHAPQP